MGSYGVKLDPTLQAIDGTDQNSSSIDTYGRELALKEMTLSPNSMDALKTKLMGSQAQYYDQLVKNMAADRKAYDESFGGKYLGMSNTDAIKAGMGIGQLGLGIMGYLDAKKTAAKERELMDQKIASNKFLLTQAQGRQADIQKAFGSNGLAASQKLV